MSNKILGLYCSRGFALLDVMIATLVLAVGVIAFVNLENMSIKRSQQINYRLQATASANALIEVLRSDRGMIPWLVAKKENIIVVDEKTTKKFFCRNDSTGDKGKVNLEHDDTWCSAGSDQIRKDLLAEIQKSFSENFQFVKGKAVMCLYPADVNLLPTEVRITVVWKNANKTGFVAAKKEDCPADYSGDNGANENLVNIALPDRGYFEVFTRI